jgi:hypothetical protein
MLYDKGSVGEGSERRKEVTLLYDCGKVFPGCTIFPVSPFYFLLPYTVLYPRGMRTVRSNFYLVGSCKEPTNQPRSFELFQIKLSSFLRITFIPIVSVVHYLQLRSFLLSTHRLHCFSNRVRANASEV